MTCSPCLSFRNTYVAFTDAMEDAMNPQRHIGRITAPFVVSCGTLKTPEFQCQAQNLSSAIEAAGKPVQFVRVRDYFHQNM